MISTMQLPSGYAVVKSDIQEQVDLSTYAIIDNAKAPHVYVTIKDERVLGIGAAHPGPLRRDAQTAVELFLASLNYPLMCETSTIGGRVMDSRGEFHEIDALPDAVHIRGHLWLRNKTKLVLPRRILIVDGDLFFDHCEVEVFPFERLEVSGSASFAMSDVAILPAVTSIGRDMDAGPRMQHLPEKLSVGRIMRLGDTQIRTVPEGTVCGGPIMFDRGQIETLPNSVADATLVYIFSADGTTNLDGNTFVTTALWCRHQKEIMAERRAIRAQIAARSRFDAFKDFILGRASPSELLKRNYLRSQRLSVGIADS